MKSFGSNLKAAREKNQLTQQALANRLYVTRQAVSRWENNARYPDIVTLKKISVILNVSADELLCDEDIKIYDKAKEGSRRKILSVLLILYLIITAPDTIISILEVFNPEISTFIVLSIANHISPVITAFFMLICNIKNILTTYKIRNSLIICFGINVLCSIIFMITGIADKHTTFTLGNGIIMLINIGSYIFFLIAIFIYFSGKKRSPLPMYICCFNNFLMSYSSFIQFITIVNNGVVNAAENTKVYFYLLQFLRIGAAFMELAVLFYITYSYKKLISRNKET